MDKEYEITLILNEGGSPDEVLAVLEQNGAAIIDSSDFGDKNLAYSIEKVKRARLWNIIFSCSPKALAKIEKALLIKKSVLRFLIVNRLKFAEKPLNAKSREAKVEKSEPVEKIKAEPVKVEEATTPDEAAPAEKVEEKPEAVKPVKANKVTKPAEEPAAKKTVKAKKAEKVSAVELDKTLEELVKED